jgi:hypothetical protein
MPVRGRISGSRIAGAEFPGSAEWRCWNGFIAKTATRVDLHETAYDIASLDSSVYDWRAAEQDVSLQTMFTRGICRQTLKACRTRQRGATPISTS